MNRILKITIASTIVLASITGAALAQGGHGGHGGHGNHGADRSMEGRVFSGHDLMHDSRSDAVLPWYLINGHKDNMAR